MIDLMKDVETIGNIPGCVVLQVTVVPFSLRGKEFTDGLGVFDCKLHAGEQIAKGYDVDLETLKWWMQQEPEVRKRVFTGNTSIIDFCAQYENYLGLAKSMYNDYRIWSTSAKVDFGCVPVLFKREGIFYPQNHRAERDARSINWLAKTLIPQLKYPKGVNTHDAIDDCRRQIADLQCSYNALQDAFQDKGQDANPLIAAEIQISDSLTAEATTL